MSETYQYDSLNDFITALESPLRNESNFHSREMFKNAAMGDLAGLTEGTPWESVKKLWREGWQEGIDKTHKALGELEPPRLKDRRRKARWSDEGEEFDRDRLYSGHFDDSWRQVRREIRQAPAPVRITVDVEAHVNIAHGSLFWRGAGVVMLAESLGAVGYPVSVVATSGAAGMGMVGGKYTQYITVTVKDWQMPVYLPTLIATTGHGSFLRCGVFAHNVQYMPGKHTGGMGYSLTTSTYSALAELGFNEKNIRTVIMPQSVGTLESAKEWATETVALLESEALVS